MNILITGGPGFIGAHLADALLAAGHRVRILDNLSSQVHGDRSTPPPYLSSESEVRIGAIRDREAVADALDGIDAVYHCAASDGEGQSMYRVRDYIAVNDLGTVALLQHLLEPPVERLIAASSMSIYGEGLYQDADGREIGDAARDPALLMSGAWEPTDVHGRPLGPFPTPARKGPEC